MPKVLISDKMSPLAEKILKERGIEVEVKPGLPPEEQAKIIGDYDGLLIRSATKLKGEVLEAARNLKIVARAGEGTDNIDKPRCSELGVLVTNTPGQNTTTTGEHAIALMLSLVRNIPQGTATLKAGEWAKNALAGREICGKTLGVVGVGKVGRVVLDRALGLRMKAAAYDPNLSQAEVRGLGAEPVSLDELYAKADIITIHVPLTPATKGLVNEAAFGKMKKGVFLVNASRGGIVDEAALLKALDEGKVAGAAVDVFAAEPPPKDDPLVAHPKVICTPHLGASTKEAEDFCAIAAADQVAGFLLEGRVKNALNADKIVKK